MSSLAELRARLEEVDFIDQYNWALSIIKDGEKLLKKANKKTKKEPKLDDDGNVIKNEVPAQLKPWKDYSKAVFEKLMEITEGNIVPKAANRISKILKDAGHYPIENLDDSILEDTYNEWAALPKELQFPKKGKGSSSDSAESSTETEEEKPKVVEVKKAEVKKAEPKKAEVKKEEAKKEDAKPVVEAKPVEKEAVPAKKAPAKKAKKGE